MEPRSRPSVLQVGWALATTEPPVPRALPAFLLRHLGYPYSSFLVCPCVDQAFLEEPGKGPVA